MRVTLAAFALAAAACGQGGSIENSQAVEGSHALQLELTGRVVDEANIIDQVTEDALISRLDTLEAQTRDQLVVVTVPSLHDQPIEKASRDLANRWGVGRADLDNGVMLMVAPNERSVRIQVGFGLEGLLTDERAAEIIQVMLPEFLAGRIQEGVVRGVNSIEAILKSDNRRPRPKAEALKKAA